jgi:delta 1-pyrroline-5-carboxylate dehydrogenase
MDELEIGDPAQLATDVGPVIDERARQGLLAHIEEMRRSAGSCTNAGSTSATPTAASSRPRWSRSTASAG